MFEEICKDVEVFKNISNYTCDGINISTSTFLVCQDLIANDVTDDTIKEHIAKHPEKWSDYIPSDYFRLVVRDENKCYLDYKGEEKYLGDNIEICKEVVADLNRKINRAKTTEFFDDYRNNDVMSQFKGLGKL